jgi:hypothetical protein
MSVFIGGQRDLAVIRGALDAPGPSLMVVYGRRRIDKSTCESALNVAPEESAPLHCAA